MTAPQTGLQLHSTVRSDRSLELSLGEVPLPTLGDADVLVRVEAAPINPSDLGLLFGPADVRTAKVAGTAERPVVTAEIPERAMGMVAARLDEPMPVGNEGAGVVIAAGASEVAQALVGRTVGIVGGATYAQFRALPAALCLPLPEGTTAAEGAACFVNPLTALGMVETMKRKGHSALVHTAAASNLGQMLQKLCLADDVPLVNIVRKPEQQALLEGIGARHVCNSSDDDFGAKLTDALAETGATIAFDATGGGTLAGRILTCMEAALNRNASGYDRYGSSTHKQVYLYGGLDRSPTSFERTFGMAWGIGGWLLTPFLQGIGHEATQALRARVAREVKTTFASHYSRHVSLAEALGLDAILTYGRQATGEKFLIEPNRGL